MLKYLSGGGDEMQSLRTLKDRVRDAPYRPAGIWNFESHIDSPNFSIEQRGVFAPQGEQSLKPSFIIARHGKRTFTSTGRSNSTNLLV